MTNARLLILPLLLWSGTAHAREVVDASAPSNLAVTVYRDPTRGQGQEMDRDWPQGFAMISETRTVTLPAGESTIRFEGVAEGMVAVSAIVTGLPGGTIEKNRNADLLSPAALVDGTLGNRVRITRTNPGTGAEQAEEAIIRTRADGGLVLQTGNGFEAVRCSGLPERLTFDAVPDGLSSEPVFTIDTRDAAGGTYAVTLTYLAWGFDWQANYVATLHEGGGSDDVRLRLMSWLTILNDNNQSFANAELMAVAGTLNVVSDFEGLSDPPDARPMRLTCYPLGSTKRGSPYPSRGLNREERIVVTGSRVSVDMMAMPASLAEMEDSLSELPQFLVSGEEQLGDLKLYRIPANVDVRAQGLKQVAFLDKGEVEGRYLYRTQCEPLRESVGLDPTDILFATVNDEEHGLGVALPSGAIAFFEPTVAGELLVGEENLRDYASGQDVEIILGQSSQVFAKCERMTKHEPHAENSPWTRMRTTLSNANPDDVTVRLVLGSPAQWDHRGTHTGIKDGQRIVEVIVPANGEKVVEWQIRPALAG